MQECTKRKKNILISDSIISKDREVFNKVIGIINFTRNAVVFHTAGEGGRSS